VEKGKLPDGSHSFPTEDEEFSKLVDILAKRHKN